CPVLPPEEPGGFAKLGARNFWRELDGMTAAMKASWLAGLGSWLERALGRHAVQPCVRCTPPFVERLTLDVGQVLRFLEFCMLLSVRHDPQIPRNVRAGSSPLRSARAALPQALLSKLGQSVAILLFASLTNFGKDVGDDLGIRLTGLVGMAFAIASLVIFTRYQEHSVVTGAGDPSSPGASLHWVAAPAAAQELAADPPARRGESQPTAKVVDVVATNAEALPSGRSHGSVTMSCPLSRARRVLSSIQERLLALHQRLLPLLWKPADFTVAWTVSHTVDACCEQRRWETRKEGKRKRDKGVQRAHVAQQRRKAGGGRRVGRRRGGRLRRLRSSRCPRTMPGAPRRRTPASSATRRSPSRISSSAAAAPAAAASAAASRACRGGSGHPAA
ncbi:unnamed protein product, partial [Prorocentrum cordatum]